MDNNLSSIATDDLQVQHEQLRKVEAEKKARKLLKQETSDDYSYEQLIEKHFNGFMHFYVKKTANYKEMTTSAKRDVVLSLAKIDLLGNQIFSKIALCMMKTKP